MNDEKEISLETILRSRGCRMTAVRKAILRQFSPGHLPLSAAAIQKGLRAKKCSADKTTVYRELSFLKNAGIIKEVAFGDRKRRYEATGGDHHHHLVCVRCRGVEDIALRNDLDREEHQIAHSKKFTVLNHSLEFFGICAKCR